MASFDTFLIKTEHFDTVSDSTYFREMVGSFDFDENGGHRTKKFIKTNNTWRAKMEKQGLYMPLYGISANSFMPGRRFFYLQFSAPKMLHGHSNIETFEKDRKSLIEAIVKFCNSIKVAVTPRAIEEAIVRRVDFCQNIPMKSYDELTLMLNILSNFNSRPKTKKLIITKDDLGEIFMLQFPNSQSHLTVYNKIKEIIADAITMQEQGIADYMQKRTLDHPYKNSAVPNLRIELSEHNATSVKQMMWNFYQKKAAYTFKEVFQDHIAAKMLQKEVNQVYNHPLKSIAANSKQDFSLIDEKIKNFINDNFTHSNLKGLLYQAATIVLAKGWAGVKNTFKEQGSLSTYKRNVKRLRMIENLGISLNTPNDKLLEYFLSQFGITGKIGQSVQQNLF